MRILCCLDGTNAETIGNAVTALLRNNEMTINLLYVTDTGPHKEMERKRARFLRPYDLASPRQNQIQQTEEQSAQDILDEGERYLAPYTSVKTSRAGRPEREVVNYAAEWQADLLVICPRALYGESATIGPKSVGHVARFVLDHAPCPVLLVRPSTRNLFPIAR